MSLYIVIHENEYYERGIYVEDIEGMMVQPTHMVKDDDGSYIPMYSYGIAYPRDKVRKYILKIMKRGLDREVLNNG